LSNAKLVRAVAGRSRNFA